MRQSILRYFISLLLVSLCICSATSIFIISGSMKEDSEREMMYSVKLIEYNLDYSKDLNTQIETLNPLAFSDDTRISVIDEKGKVLADTYKKDISSNHLKREEMQQALHSSNHEGYAMRRSETTNQPLLYAAYYKDNHIIRLSIPYSGVWGYFPELAPAFSISILISILFSYIVARKLSKRVTKPLTEISESLNNMTEDYRFELPTTDYEEFTPIIDTIENLSHRLRKSMRETRFEQDKINAILRKMEEGFILLDENGMILSVNDSAIKILGPLKEKDNLIDHITYPNLINALNSAPKKQRIELKIHDFDYQCAISRLPFGTALFFVDITAMKNSQKMREEFFSSVSHELKTPITAIRGYSELLSQGFINDENQKKMMLSKIQTEVTNMSSLINDILMLSRLDSDDLIVEKVPVKMQALMKDISEDYEGLLLKYNVELHTDVEPITYIGNGSQIETLISNLVSNAIKYNKEDGHVYVHIYSKKDNMIIEVKDTGIGIPLADQGRVFERFYRVDKGRSRIKGGTGLGLAIVKHIVSYNKGTVKLHSQLGEGTCITITLPNKS